MEQRRRGISSKWDVVIIGAGPVGLTLAMSLGRTGIDVLLLEREAGPPKEGRASTIHASTLELLDELNIAEEAVSQGAPARTVQYRDLQSGEAATFDLDVLSPLTDFPFRLQLEQNQLCTLMLEALKKYPNVEVLFQSEATAVNESRDEVEVRFSHDMQEHTVIGKYVIGADGAHSLVRREANIDLEGSTYPFTMLTLSTFADLNEIVRGISPVTYIFDAKQAMAFLRIKDHWRISLNTTAPMPKDTKSLKTSIIAMASKALGHDFDIQNDVKSVNTHRIHQRVADTFGTERVLLAGDSAHLNSPTGGMGMNSGIHDACALFPYLVKGLEGQHSSTLFEDYKSERKRVATEVVGFASDNNTRDMRASAVERRNRIKELQQIASNDALALEFLRGSTMLDDAPSRSDLQRY